VIQLSALFAIAQLLETDDRTERYQLVDGTTFTTVICSPIVSRAMSQLDAMRDLVKQIPKLNDLLVKSPIGTIDFGSIDVKIATTRPATVGLCVHTVIYDDGMEACADHTLALLNSLYRRIESRFGGTDCPGHMSLANPSPSIVAGLSDKRPTLNIIRIS
jgi:hypothetical protein